MNGERYNVVVIGGGTAGLVTAAGTAGLGGRVALVERNKMGGDCLNFGCVPSKALIASARAIHTIRRAEDFGLRKVEPQFEFREVFARMRARRARIAPNDSQERFESLGVDVFRGEARFLSPYEVQVNGQTLRAANFVIAAGSRAAVPPIPGLKDVPYFTNETIFDKLSEKPQSLIVIGGGPIGCELAQVFQRLGVQVTLLENGPQILSKEDPDVAAFVETRLRAEGVRIVYCSDTKRIVQRDGLIHATVASKPPCDPDLGLIEIAAEKLLVAAGRVPNVEDLGLEAAGVKFNRQGIEVNQYLQTSQPNIYAAGDIVGPYQFTHKADFQARTAVRNILLPFAKAKVDYSVVPWSTYVDPEVAHVGLNETEAKKRGLAYDLFTQRMDELDRAVVSDEDAGFVKILAAKGTDKILGVTLVGAHAGDLIHEFVLAIKYGIGLGKIAATIHAYPTLAEVARKLGDQYQRTRLTPFAKKLFAWLYRRARGQRGESMQAEQQMNLIRKIPWTWTGLAVVVTALVLAGRLLPLDRWLEQFSNWVAGFGPAGVVLYSAVYAAAAVLFVPGSVLTVGAGFVFGIFWGTLAVSLGSTLGAALAFLIARHLARDRVAQLALKNARFAAIDQAIGAQGWKIVVLLRLSPLIPFNLSNYLYGLTAVPFWPYLIASWAGMLPGTLLYVYLGVAGKAGLEAAAGRGTAYNPLQMALLVTGLVATIIVTWFVSRIARKALQKTSLSQEASERDVA